MISKQALGKTLWGMANILYDKVDDYKSYILPLLFYKRLSDDYQWGNVIRSVGCIESKNETSLEEQISLNIKKSKIQKQIDALKKKIKNEKQFNRQIEIKAEIKKLEEMIR